MPDDYTDIIAAATSDPPPALRKVVRGGDKLKGVQPDLLDHWNALQDEFSKAGITPTIKSGYRTAEQQNALFTNPATHARTKGNDGYVKISPHQEGRALDVSFNAAQKPKGRQIIADYARRTGLHVPSDEPWHIAVLKKEQEAQGDDYADIVKAAGGDSAQAGDDYSDVIEAASKPVQLKPVDLSKLNITEESAGQYSFTNPTSGEQQYFNNYRELEQAINKLGGRLQQPSKQDAEAPLYAVQASVPHPRPTGMGEVRQEERPVYGTSELGQLRTTEGTETARTQRLRTAIQHEQELTRQIGRSSPNPAMAAGYEERELAGRTSAEHQQEDQQLRDQPELSRLVPQYRAALHQVGAISGQGWQTEMGAKGTAGLLEYPAAIARFAQEHPNIAAVLSPLLATGGSVISPDTLRLHSTALQQAAVEEGMDRSEASKFVQDLMAGLVSSAPELAAMSAGIPPVAAFAAGGGTRAYGMRRPVLPAAVHGGATGAAFEVAPAGEGLANAFARMGTVGAATLPVELAYGANFHDALAAAATNALMAGGPEALRAVGDINVLRERALKISDADLGKLNEQMAALETEQGIAPLAEEAPAALSEWTIAKEGNKWTATRPTASGTQSITMKSREALEAALEAQQASSVSQDGERVAQQQPPAAPLPPVQQIYKNRADAEAAQRAEQGTFDDLEFAKFDWSPEMEAEFARRAALSPAEQLREQSANMEAADQLSARMRARDADLHEQALEGGWYDPTPIDIQPVVPPSGGTNIASATADAADAKYISEDRPAQLPRELAGAKPRYSYGSKQFGLEFESDFDRAAYITAQTKRSKSDASYLQWSMDQSGLDEAAVRAHGAQVRAAIKKQAKGSQEPVLKIERVSLSSEVRPAQTSTQAAPRTETAAEKTQAASTPQGPEIVYSPKKGQWVKNPETGEVGQVVGEKVDGTSIVRAAGKESSEIWNVDTRHLTAPPITPVTKGAGELGRQVKAQREEAKAENAARIAEARAAIEAPVPELSTQPAALKPVEVGDKLTHTNPAHDGKKVLAVLPDGRTVVPTPENADGVSRLKPRDFTADAELLKDYSYRLAAEYKALQNHRARRVGLELVDEDTASNYFDRLYRFAETHNPEKAPDLVDRAESAYHRGKFADAIAYAEQALSGTHDFASRVGGVRMQLQLAAKGNPIEAKHGQTVSQTVNEVRRRTEEPSFITRARERVAKEEEFRAAGGKKFGSGGPDTRALIDQLLVRGYDFYTGTVKPTFEDWASKLRVEFGERVEPHLKNIWARVSGAPESVPQNISPEERVAAEEAAQTRIAERRVSGEGGFVGNKEEAEKLRSLPETLKRSGRAPGTNLTYDPLPNEPEFNRVQKRLTEEGPEKLEEWYRTAPESAERTFAHEVLVDHYQAQAVADNNPELKARATELSNIEAERATLGGQATQAYAHLNKYNPAGLSLEVAKAKRRMESVGKELSIPATELEKAETAAQVHKAADAEVKKKRAVVQKLEVEAGITEPVAVGAGKGPGSGGGSSRGSGKGGSATITTTLRPKSKPRTPARTLKDIIRELAPNERVRDGAERMIGDTDLGRWMRETKSIHKLSQEDATRLGQLSHALVKKARKALITERRMNTLRKKYPDATTDELLVAYEERDAAIKRRRDAQMELERFFDRLSQKQQGYYRRSLNAVRGAMVAAFPTMMRNSETQGVRAIGVERGTDILEHTLKSAVRPVVDLLPETVDRLFHDYVGLNSDFTYRSIARNTLRALKMSEKTARNILSEHPAELARMFNNYAGGVDVPIPNNIKGAIERTFRTTEEAIRLANTLNTIQEFHWRSVEFLAELDLHLQKDHNMTLERFVSRYGTDAIPKEFIKKAVDKGLEVTFAASPDPNAWGGKQVAAVIEFANYFPPTVPVISAFPRFLYNNLKFLYQYNPTGLLDIGMDLARNYRITSRVKELQANSSIPAYSKSTQISKLESGRTNPTRALARTLIGTSMLLLGYQVRKSEWDENKNKWYQIKVGGHTFDTRPFGPFSTYLFLGEVARRAANGEKLFTKRELAEVLGSTTGPGGSAIAVSETLFDLFTDWSAGDDTAFTKAMRILKTEGGELGRALLTPVRQVKTLISAFDRSQAVIHDTSGSPLLGPVQESLPYASGSLPYAYQPTTAAPIQSAKDGLFGVPPPLTTFFTGAREERPRTFLEHQLDELHIESREVVAPTGNPKVDAFQKKAAGPIMDQLSSELEADPEFRQLSPAARTVHIKKEVLPAVRDEVRQLGEEEMPDEYEKLKEQRKPAYQRQLEKEQNSPGLSKALQLGVPLPIPPMRADEDDLGYRARLLQVGKARRTALDRAVAAADFRNAPVVAQRKSLHAALA